MYHWRCNLNKLSSRQRQTKTAKIHKKLSEEYCNTLPTIELGRPARGMGSHHQASGRGQCSPIQPKAILANPAQRPNI